MITPQGDNLIFIMSAPRSGSTLLGVLLSASEEATCPSELWIQLPYAALDPNQKLVDADYDQNLANEAIVTLFPRDKDGTEPVHEAIRRHYSQLLAKSGTRCLIDKTPRYYHIPWFLSERWPAARMIWLRRSPLDVITSCKSHWGISVAEQMGEQASPHTHDCTTAFTKLNRFFGERPEAPRIKYEDLVSDGGTSLRHLFEQLGLAAPKGDPLQYQASPGSSADQDSPRFGDDKVWQHKTAHRGSIGRWKTGLDRDELTLVLTRLGRDCFAEQGYAEEYDEALGMIGGTLPRSKPDQAKPKDPADNHFAIRRQLSAAQEELRNLRTQLDDLSKNSVLAGKDKDQEIDLLRSQLDELSRNSTSAGEAKDWEIELLRSQLEEMQRELTAACEEKDKAANRANMAEAQLADLEKNFTALESDYNERGTVIENQGKKAAELEATIHGQLEKMNQLYSQVEELKKSVWLTEQDRDAWKTRAEGEEQASP